MGLNKWLVGTFECIYDYLLDTNLIRGKKMTAAGKIKKVT